MAEAHRIVPGQADSLAGSCGPISCRFWGTRADNGATICWKVPRTFTWNEMDGRRFPEWCPLEEAK